MKQKILAFIGIVMVAALAFGVMPVEAAKTSESGGTEVAATGDENGGGGCGGNGFLGLRAWYAGLPCENGAIKAPSGDASGASIAQFVWTIVANVLVDLFMVVGFLAVGFLMYGGYLYIMSNGDPGKAASGMKTIKAAIIGLIIAILANVIIRTILVILGI